jgi:hypothetical protein
MRAPLGGWFDGLLMTRESGWGRKWHHLTRELGGTYWAACGPLWLVSLPHELREDPGEGDVCRKCLGSVATTAVHYRDGRVRSACGIRPPDARATSIEAEVTCGRCKKAIGR